QRFLLLIHCPGIVAKKLCNYFPEQVLQISKLCTEALLEPVALVRGKSHHSDARHQASPMANRPRTLVHAASVIMRSSSSSPNTALVPRKAAYASMTAQRIRDQSE